MIYVPASKPFTNVPNVPNVRPCGGATVMKGDGPDAVFISYR